MQVNKEVFTLYYSLARDKRTLVRDKRTLVREIAA